MAGGVKKPVNIFKLKDLGEPEGAFNWRLWFAVVSFGLLGAARGIDEGLISGAFNSPDFKNQIKYDTYSKEEKADIKANVSAMVQIGSVGGALMYARPATCGRHFADFETVHSWFVIASVVFGQHASSVPSGLWVLPSS